MSAPSPLPDHIYKIIPIPPNHSAGSNFPLSDLDRNDGYIHLSTAQQVPITAKLFFNNETRLIIQKVSIEDMRKKGGEIKWEAISDGSVFPHWYFEPLAEALNGIGELHEYQRDATKSWLDVLKDL